MTATTLRRAAILALAAASPAAAQETITYSLNFVEVIAGSAAPGIPVTNSNGVLDPGEAARIQLTISISPGIGSPATYSPPPAPGVGTIAGLGSIWFDLIGSGSNGGAGTWTGLGRGAGWALGSVGTPSALGDRVTSCQAGQFILPAGPLINSSNPIPNIWRGIWTPQSYAGTFDFTAFAAAAAGASHSSILIEYGTDPNTGSPLYVGKFVAAQFSTIHVLIVPAPTTLVPVVFMGFFARRRR